MWVELWQNRRRRRQVLDRVVPLSLAAGALFATTSAHADEPAADNAASANAAATPADAAAARARAVPSISLSAGVGVDFIVGSDQEDLLDDEGYSGARFHVSAEFRKSLGEHFGLGVIALFGWRNATADPNPAGNYESVPLAHAPTYSERLFVAGAELPITFCLCNHSTARLTLAPFVGPAFGRVELYRETPGHWAPAFGGSAELFFPKAFLGFSAGAYFAPFSAPGEAAAATNLGAYFLSFILGFDVG